MNATELVNEWVDTDQTVSFTICDHHISALVFVKGEPYTVHAENYETLIEKIDNTLHDCRVTVV